MIVFGWIVISIVLACAVAGAIAACKDDEKGLGKEFLEGIYAIGYIFLPVAGIMASIPFLTALIETVLKPIYVFIGADPAMAATTFIAVDMGGYQLARSLTTSNESWMTAMTTGYMAGATIVFSIPVGLALLQKSDHKYMALGAMAGLLAIPIGVLVANLLLWIISPDVRDFVGTKGAANHPLQMSPGQIFLDIAPLAAIMSALALGLRLAPDLMVRLFMGFGRVIGILIKLVLVICIVEYFTAATFEIGLVTKIFGSAGFDPIIADADQVKDIVKETRAITDDKVIRALEVAGYIGIMLAGAFPMVYLIRKFLSGPIESVGRKIGLDAVGAAGMLATIANILAMFRLIKDMRPRDKVLNIAFAVCAAFMFGDHLSFTTNFQPSLLAPVLLGKLAGGVCGFLIATWWCVPKALQLAEEDILEQVTIVLKRVPALANKTPTAITKLRGGLTNVIYKIDYAGESYIVRLFGAGTDLLGIDRERENTVSQAVAAAGVGPDVIAYLAKGSVAELHDFQGAAVIGFVAGKLLDGADAKHPEMLHRIAETLKRYHAAPGAENVGTFSVFEIVKKYAKESVDRGVAVPTALGDALVLLDRIEKELHTDEPLCLCHNDLLAGNFINDGKTMRIIDWEYGARGDRFFDLGNLAVNLQMSEDQERALLHAYFGAAPPAHLRRLTLMRSRPTCARRRGATFRRQSRM